MTSRNRIAPLLRLRDFVEITRPHNLLVAVLVILGGWAVSGADGSSPELLWALAAAALVAAAGNVINDTYDAPIDRINKPRRPIPSGRLSGREAVGFFVILTLLALAAGVRSGPVMAWIVAIWTLALTLYSAWLKRRFLLGNLTVSLVCSSGFLAGAWVAGHPESGVVPTLIAALFLMGREIVKDVEDLPGDSACGARTLARVLGARRALKVALAFFVLFAVGGFWPYWSRVCGMGYLWTYVLGVLPLLALAVTLMFRDPRPGNLVRVSWILKLDMLVAALGFYLGMLG